MRAQGAGGRDRHSTLNGGPGPDGDRSLGDLDTTMGDGPSAELGAKYTRTVPFDTGLISPEAC